MEGEGLWGAGRKVWRQIPLGLRIVEEEASRQTGRNSSNEGPWVMSRPLTQKSSD